MDRFAQHELSIGGREIIISVPQNPDEVLDASVNSEEQVDPYWAVLWSAAKPTAEELLKEDWPTGTTALELGCGAGLVGVAGLFAGLNVTFTDVVQEAVDLAIFNAARNGFPAVSGRLLDWNVASGNAAYDLIIASDVLYEIHHHEPILRTVSKLLKHNGQVWIGDPGRKSADDFRDLAVKGGWAVDVRRPLRNEESAFQLFVLTRREKELLEPQPVD